VLQLQVRCEAESAFREHAKRCAWWRWWSSADRGQPRDRGAWGRRGESATAATRSRPSHPGCCTSRRCRCATRRDGLEEEEEPGRRESPTRAPRLPRYEPSTCCGSRPGPAPMPLLSALSLAPASGPCAKPQASRLPTPLTPSAKGQCCDFHSPFHDLFPISCNWKYLTCFPWSFSQPSSFLSVKP
jgi:hypothetical protein